MLQRNQIYAIRFAWKAVAWSPGSDVWLDRFRSLWRQTRGSDPIKVSCRPTIYSPPDLAIWRPMAEALGWPKRPIGWKAILEPANNSGDWASLGHAEWGRFKLGHPHPQYSNAGMQVEMTLTAITKMTA